MISVSPIFVRLVHQMVELDAEQIDVDGLCDDQAQVERGLQPAAPEDDLGQADVEHIARGDRFGFAHAFLREKYPTSG
jgi:hypothetical protein